MVQSYTRTDLEYIKRKKNLNAKQLPSLLRIPSSPSPSPAGLPIEFTRTSLLSSTSVVGSASPRSTRAARHRPSVAHCPYLFSSLWQSRSQCIHGRPYLQSCIHGRPHSSSVSSNPWLSCPRWERRSWSLIMSWRRPVARENCLFYYVTGLRRDFVVHPWQRVRLWSKLS